MKSLCSFLIVALAVATSMLPSVRSQDCTDACMSCKMKGKCDASDMLQPDGECPPAEACTLLNGIPSCVPIAQTSCDCDGGRKGCDPIDDTKIIYCIRGNLYEADCDGGEQCIGTGECVATTPAPPTPPPPTCSDASFTGFLLFEPDCTAALFCAGGNEIDVTECQETEYFDLSSGNCEPYPPPNPCGCGMAKCPVIEDCSKYLLCDGDQVLDEETCSVDGKTFFDPATGDCVADDGTAESVCTDYKDCMLPEVSYAPETTSESAPDDVTTPASDTTPLSDTTPPSDTTPAADTTQPPVTTPASTTTTRPATCSAANAGRRYPHETDCKKYYTCREITRGRYEYVESTCPGSLLFDKVNRYCDLPQNVPDCQQ